MTDYFKDAPPWADTVLFSESQNKNIFAFSKVDKLIIDGKENEARLFSWPGFDPKQMSGKFVIVAEREVNFSGCLIGIDKGFYDSVKIENITSLMLPTRIKGVDVNSYYGPNLSGMINPDNEYTKSILSTHNKDYCEKFSDLVKGLIK